MSAVPLAFTDARLLDGRRVDVFTAEGRIVAVQPAGELRPQGERIRLDGRTVIPGLWDRHVHFAQWALASRRVDLSTAGSAAEAARLLAERARTQAGGEVVGGGFRDALWADAPHRALLDALAPDRPLIAVSGDLHCVWLNSAGLAAHGLAGHETGVLREAEAFRITRALEQLPDALSDARAREAGRAAAARGVVGIVDFEMSWNVPVWERRLAGGFDVLRVEAGFYPQHLEQALALGLASGDALDADGLLLLGSLKIITDGSLNTRTAYCFEPYPGMAGAEAHGLLTVSPDELVPLLHRAVSAGLHVAVHAIGDRANALALDAMALTGARGSIEHAQLLAEPELARFAELGVVASVQPEHAMDDRDVAERYWAGRTGRAFMLRGLLDAGARLALGSDAPVAPLDPWVAISAAVGRSRDGRPPWHPEQAISTRETIDASVRSTIAPGQPADLVVLETDPLALDSDALRTLPVSASYLAGRSTFSRETA